MLTTIGLKNLSKLPNYNHIYLHKNFLSILIYQIFQEITRKKCIPYYFIDKFFYKYKLKNYIVLFSFFNYIIKGFKEQNLWLKIKTLRLKELENIT